MPRDLGGGWIPGGASHPEPAKLERPPPPQKIPAGVTDPESTLMRAGAEPTTPPQDPRKLADPASTLMRAGAEAGDELSAPVSP
jgi:hypothetical protein